MTRDEFFKVMSDFRKLKKECYKVFEEMENDFYETLSLKEPWEDLMQHMRDEMLGKLWHLTNEFYFHTRFFNDFENLKQ